MRLGKRGACLSVKTDVQNINDCRRLIEKTIESFDKIDILINNAGISSMRANFEELDLKVIKERMDTIFFRDGILHQVCNALFNNAKGNNYWYAIYNRTYSFTRQNRVQSI